MKIKAIEIFLAMIAVGAIASGVPGGTPAKRTRPTFHGKPNPPGTKFRRAFAENRATKRNP